MSISSGAEVFPASAPSHCCILSVDYMLGISLVPAGTTANTELMPTCGDHALGDCGGLQQTRR